MVRFRTKSGGCIFVKKEDIINVIFSADGECVLNLKNQETECGKLTYLLDESIGIVKLKLEL